MRRRVVLLASLLASLAAHAAALVGLAALSSGPRVTVRARRPIDVELLAPAPLRAASGPSLPRAASPVAATTPAADGAPRRGASRPAARTGHEAQPALPPAAGNLSREVLPPNRSAPPAGGSESARVASASPVEGSERGEISADRDGMLVPPGGSRAEETAPGGPMSGEGASWKPPEPAERNCVEDAVRLPASLRGFVSGTFSVKFAVAPDGTPGELQILGKLPDERVGGVVWRAIRGCRWTPGTDVRGRPAKVWIVMPVRFARG